jgi:6-pyruvoyltetrahydropterin/6-carboxytetrahydropterin synthase
MTQMTIARRWRFAAAHQLDKLPEDHKCHRLHGHNYTCEIEVSGDLDGMGMVVDYAVLDGVCGNDLKARFDHRNLNDLIPVSTAENLAIHLLETWTDLLDGVCSVDAVTVWETEGSWARAIR